MTTAHRPTFNPARGGTARGENDLSKLSHQYSSKDMPANLTLKYRQPGQAAEDDIRAKDLRRDLDDKERTAAHERKRQQEAKLYGVGESVPSSGGGGSSASKRVRLDEVAGSGRNLDADEPLDEVEDSDDDDSDSDEEDTAALMAELARIKKERAAEKSAQEERQRKEEERVRLDQIMHGNPLLNLGGTSSGAGADSEFKVKRRWDDDVVFKNCAKGIDERKKEARFINDAIRSDFNRKFMEKYIK